MYWYYANAKTMPKIITNIVVTEEDISEIVDNFKNLPGYPQPIIFEAEMVDGDDFTFAMYDDEITQLLHPEGAEYRLNPYFIIFEASLSTEEI